MKLFTQAQYDQLLANGRERDHDHPPVVRLFTPDAGCTWLLSEIDPEDTDLAFGLCDLGMGFPELGCVSITELSNLRGKLGLPVERDRWFSGDYPLSVYAHAAHVAGCITEDDKLLAQSAKAVKEG